MRNLAFINLNTLKENALTVKSKLKKNTKFCSVVKADGYGHGAEKCAQALYSVSDFYAVAILEEGISLRLSGIDKDILVLNPLFKEDLSRAIYYGLTATCDSIDNLLGIKYEAERQNRIVNIHIKYNTGMNRYGVDSLEEISKMIEIAKNSPLIKITGVYSHLSNPEDEKSRTRAKLKFLLANKLIKGYNNKAVAHLSASGGFLFGLEFDMVRIGILNYGYKPFASDKIKVKPVMKLYSPITKNRKLFIGDTALYGDKKVTFDTDLSLVRYGYADGLLRIETEDIFNNRCMDVSLIYGRKNGYALVMGDADSLAKKYKTISYEILTKCAIRAEKIYLN